MLFCVTWCLWFADEMDQTVFPQKDKAPGRKLFGSKIRLRDVNLLGVKGRANAPAPSPPAIPHPFSTNRDTYTNLISPSSLVKRPLSEVSLEGK